MSTASAAPESRISLQVPGQRLAPQRVKQTPALPQQGTCTVLLCYVPAVILRVGSVAAAIGTLSHGSFVVRIQLEFVVRIQLVLKHYEKTQGFFATTLPFSHRYSGVRTYAPSCVRPWPLDVTRVRRRPKNARAFLRGSWLSWLSRQ